MESNANPTTLPFASRSRKLNSTTLVLRESQNQWHSPVGTDLPSRCFRGGLACVVIRREGSITTQASTANAEELNANACCEVRCR